MNIIRNHVKGCGLVTFALIRDDADDLVLACWTEDEEPETDEPWVLTSISMPAGEVWSDREIFTFLQGRIERNRRKTQGETDADTD